MNLIKTSAGILADSPKENWEGALLSFFDMASQSLREPKDGATDIYQKVKQAASGLEFELRSRDKTSDLDIIQTALKSWWSVASMHEDTLWNMRPF